MGPSAACGDRPVDRRAGIPLAIVVANSKEGSKVVHVWAASWRAGSQRLRAGGGPTFGLPPAVSLASTVLLLPMFSAASGGGLSLKGKPKRVEAPHAP